MCVCECGSARERGVSGWVSRKAGTRSSVLQMLEEFLKKRFSKDTGESEEAKRALSLWMGAGAGAGDAADPAAGPSRARSGAGERLLLLSDASASSFWVRFTPNLAPILLRVSFRGTLERHLNPRPRRPVGLAARGGRVG